MHTKVKINDEKVEGETTERQKVKAEGEKAKGRGYRILILSLNQLTRFTHLRLTHLGLTQLHPADYLTFVFLLNCSILPWLKNPGLHVPDRSILTKPCHLDAC